jgi:hypothetical protein
MRTVLTKHNKISLPFVDKGFVVLLIELCMSLGIAILKKHCAFQGLLQIVTTGNISRS